MASPLILTRDGTARSLESGSPRASSEKARSDVSSQKGADTKAETLSDLSPVTFQMKDIFLPRSRRKIPDLDTVATQPSVFDDPNLKEHYMPPESWENTKNFDPDLRWTWREEKAIVRILDREVLVWVCLFFAILNLDRGNLGAANSDGFLTDLKLSTNDFNNANTIFRCAFLFAELPGQIISKRVGPDVFVPCQMVAWGIVTLAQFWVNGRTSFLLLRGLLGLCQGSMIPDLLLLLSYFYRNGELAIRLCWFWVSMNATSFISTFFSYGVLCMRGIRGKEGWRWLFLVEGCITIAFGLFAFFVMPASPSQTKRVWSKKPFLDERQTRIAVSRVLRDDAEKSSMHNRQGLSVGMVWRVVKNWRLYPVYVLGITFGIPAGPVQRYLTLSLKQLGFSTLVTQVLSSVQYAGAIITGIAVVVLSEVVNDRALVCSLEDLWVLPFLISIFSLGANPSPWTYWALATTLLATPYVHPIQASWISANAGDVATRTVAASLYNICVQLGTVLYSQIYRADDAPRYRRGNTALIIVCVVNLCLYALTKVFYVRINRSREHKWEAMSPEQRSQYLSTTKEKGNERLNFRFIH